MSQKITIIMYHYVREPSLTKHPQIKGLLTSRFKDQLAYLKRHYTFVSVADCLNSLSNRTSLPANACILTFDDGYIDHFVTVFPILKKNRIQGYFFPPAKPILTHKVLDVNKIHFILASAYNDLARLLSDIYACLDKYRPKYHLKSNSYYYSKLAIKNQFDPAEIIFIKRLLQVELEESLRGLITDDLFQKYVTNDEESFSRELYMDLEQIQCMCRDGMYIGSHAFDHRWLTELLPRTQESEITQSLEFLKLAGAPVENWVMCYPYGAYNDSLIEILKKKGCAFAFTTKAGIADFSKENAYTLERFDANDLPKLSNFHSNSQVGKTINISGLNYD